MIVSASYKTDVPAFYARWFSNRLKAGFCKVVNPFNKNQHSTVRLERHNVDGFVFWTKNLVPFMSTLNEVALIGYPFIVQYTINAYPRELETRVVDWKHSVDLVQRLAGRFGKRAVVWRYDTIILSDLTDAEFHRHNFARLATHLAGSVDECVFSFLQLYKKTKVRMSTAGRENRFEWYDPTVESKKSLLSDLAEIATDAGICPTICTQPELVVPGVGESRCIDAERLMDVGQRDFSAKLKGMRKGCGCFQAKDIGDYDTCPHGCIYCYAVRDDSLTLNRYRSHDPVSEYLYPVSKPQDSSILSDKQAKMFDHD